MEAVMEWLTVPSDGAFVSARTDSQRFFPYHYYSGYHRLGYADELYAFGGAAVANQKYRVLTRIDNGAQTASISAFVNGAWDTPQSISRAATGPVDMGLSLYLFARNFKGKADYPGHARVYRLKFREKQQDGSYKLTRDFVPVNHLTLCRSVLFLPSIFPSIRVFSNELLYASDGQSIGASATQSVLPMDVQG